MISFSKIKPSLIFFHEKEGQEFSIISTCDKNDEEYSNLLKLKRVPAIIKKEFNKYNAIDEEIKIPELLDDYRNFTHDMFLKEIKEILNIENPILNKDKTDKTNKKGLKSIEEIVGEYVFTADNFIKMVLILLRIRSNIPVIMMGETGCGKTSLIRKLSELKNNGNADKMKILNIHAGTTDQDIIDFIEKKVNNDARDLALKELERKNEYKEKGLNFVEKKLWVFLDEINTCKSMGLISELMCKHTYQGNVLFNNIVFIAKDEKSDTYKQEKKIKLESKDEDDCIYCIIKISNGNFISTGLSYVKLINSESFKLIKDIYFSQPSCLYEDSKKNIWVGNSPGSILILDSELNKIKVLENIHKLQINKFVEFENHIISASTDFKMKVWDINTYECLDTIEGYGEITAISIINENCLVTAQGIPQTDDKEYYDEEDLLQFLVYYEK